MSDIIRVYKKRDGYLIIDATGGHRYHFALSHRVLFGTVPALKTDSRPAQSGPAAVHKDAERYRWLRNSTRCLVTDGRYGVFLPPGYNEYKDNFDECIDDALAQDEKQ